MARTTSFNNKWANSGDKTPFSQFVERVNTGWEGGVDKDAPRAPQQNAWQFRADEALQDLERQGVMGWLSDVPYGLGSPAYGSDGNYYESLQANNTGNDPTSTSGFWRRVGGSFFSSVPVGTVIAVAHNNAPDFGWLKCNGTTVSRAAYPRLYEKIANFYGFQTSTDFRVPDFRGEFLRGLDDGRGLDPGRNIAQLQAQSIQSHSHGLSVLRGDRGPNQDGNLVFGDEDYYPYVPRQTDATGGTETRPRNMPVVYWIKY